MLEQREVALPVYLIGDRHVLPFSNMSFYHRSAGRAFHAAAKYCGELKAADCFDREAMLLRPAISDALIAAEMLLPQGNQAAHLSNMTDERGKHFSTGEPQFAPVLVMSVGSEDALDVLRGFDQGFDFNLPGEAPDYGFDPTKRELPFQVVHDLISGRLQPYLKCIRHLWLMGFTASVVLGLPPPPSDDDVFEQQNDFRVSRSLRYKIHWIFNRILKTECERKMDFPYVSFVDIWPATTEGGIVKPEFELGTGQLNRKAAWIALEKVIDLAMTQDVTPNAVRYELSQKYVQPVDPKIERSATFQALKKKYQEHNFVTVVCGRKFVRRLRDSLKFDMPEVNNAPSFDWRGRSFTTDAYPFLRHAPIPPDCMETLYDMFYGSPAREAIQVACGGDFVVYAVHGRKTLVTGPEPEDDRWHTDGCPPGIVRGIMYLCDVDVETGPFQYVDKQTINSVLGPPGTLVVFDSEKLVHRGNKAKSKERIALDIVFGPRIPCIPRMVIYQGTSLYPGDPFQYSLTRAQVFPVLHVAEISAEPIANISNVMDRVCIEDMLHLGPTKR